MPLTTAQKKFCSDVEIAMTTYVKYHPDYKKKMTEAMIAKQTENLATLEADVKFAQSQTDSKVVESMIAEAKFMYFLKANAMLRKISGVGVPELIGTGDDIQDYKRAMKVVSN